MPYDDAGPLTSVWTVLIGPVLITCTLPKKKKKLSSNTHQIEHVWFAPKALLYQEMDWGLEDRIKQPF
ncbi:unnamed protein product [Staurois parvus]|uniref:Uncharacterized protein n=1 Tax=Staurois parvus TaxID=386267 RepID=A0ABN9AVT1_9NEOB|nr:unnamed protein product [Staurois parvus]